MTNTDAIVNSLNNDPSMPKTAQGNVVMEVPGKANSELQKWIIGNTKEGVGYIPGQSPYINSNAALNGPKLSTDVKVTAPAGNSCATAECVAGVTPVRNPIKEGDDIRKDGANAAALVGRGAGIVSNAATEAAGVPGPHQPAGVAVAGTATGVDFVSKVVEQGLSPSAGKALFEIFSTYAGDKINERAPLVAPVTNELIEIWKGSKSTKEFTDWADARWQEFVGDSK